MSAGEFTGAGNRVQTWTDPPRDYQPSPINDENQHPPYANPFKPVTTTPSKPCCNPETWDPVHLNKSHLDPITRDLYSHEENALLPEKAVQLSLGCGNPTAMMTFLPGQTVLDLGSGT